MRSIKYRVWDKERKTYEEPILDGYVLTQGGVLFGSSVLDDWMTEIDEDSVILEQYTGLKDMNGVDIYENDIVEVCYQHWTNGDYREDLYIGVVVWNKLSANFCIKLNAPKRLTYTGDSFDFNDLVGDDCEVIGNVHQNPELLEG